MSDERLARLVHRAAAELRVAAVRFAWEAAVNPGIASAVAVSCGFVATAVLTSLGVEASAEELRAFALAIIGLQAVQIGRLL